MPPVVEVWSPNHWTAREFPSIHFHIKILKNMNGGRTCHEAGKESLLPVQSNSAMEKHPSLLSSHTYSNYGAHMPATQVPHQALWP